MRYILFISLLIMIPVANAVGERIKLVSDFAPEQTLERFITALEDKGIAILDEDGGLASGHVIKFANPLLGENIGMCGKGLRKDEPMQATIWKDENGTTWLSYETPREIVNSFGVIECGHETDNLRKTLKGFAALATEH